MCCRTITGECGSGGTNGQNGLNGMNATVSVGATATLAYGNPPIITNTGTATNAIFNFSIPEGATGAAGAAGADGDSGVAKTFWMIESTKEVGAAFLLQMATTFTSLPIYGYQYFQNPGALNDQWSQTFSLSAGSFALSAIGLTFTNRGIITWELDGVVQGTMDYYNPGVVNTIKTIALTVLTSGVHTLRGKIISKNALSTDYYCTLQTFWVKQ